MVSSLYASLMALIICWLSFRVIKMRRLHKIAYADGGVKALKVARSAHGNAIDYTPITLILLFSAEFNGLHVHMIHFIGTAFVVGRLIHAKSILKENFKGRKIGMQLTILCLFALIVLNIAYVPLNGIFSN